jgi:hypothetical protein
MNDVVYSLVVSIMGESNLHNTGVKVESAGYYRLCSLALSFMSVCQAQPLNVGTCTATISSQHDVVHMRPKGS